MMCYYLNVHFQGQRFNVYLPVGNIYLFLHYTKQWTYRSASLVVVNVHLLTQIATPLSDVDELAGELEAVTDVVGATAPLPVAQA